ncbi:hypothetical protein [Curtobacterium sp. ISL-83]|uniref:hypothetical protein n=1 Tax=Curtobacterium sp. ISL-83 TaxID=2819145 RepID=UPI001BE66D59|nr:hypothetical protein [Curtobacterium sp. ISL-83]MBT2501100.1 hypothetical protein [Curtobacterium sp. ISL-83]
MQETSRTWPIVAVSLTVVVSVIFALWAEWAVNWNDPALGGTPTHAQAQALRHELVDGLKTGDKTLFLRATSSQPDQGEKAWALCEPWASRAHISFFNDIDPNNADVQVHIIGNLHGGCNINAEWRGTHAHAAWDVSGSKGLEPSQPDPFTTTAPTPEPSVEPHP